MKWDVRVAPEVTNSSQQPWNEIVEAGGCYVTGNGALVFFNSKITDDQPVRGFPRGRWLDFKIAGD